VITTRGEPAMEFVGGEFDGELTLTKIFDNETDRELELVYDSVIYHPVTRPRPGRPRSAQVPC
jgi:hypothetical protein